VLPLDYLTPDTARCGAGAGPRAFASQRQGSRGGNVCRLRASHGRGAPSGGGAHLAARCQRRAGKPSMGAVWAKCERLRAFRASREAMTRCSAR